MLGVAGAFYVEKTNNLGASKCRFFLPEQKFCSNF
jgi:hypothetical protein